MNKEQETMLTGLTDLQRILFCMRTGKYLRRDSKLSKVLIYPNIRDRNDPDASANRIPWNFTAQSLFVIGRSNIEGLRKLLVIFRNNPGKSFEGDIQRLRDDILAVDTFLEQVLANPQDFGASIEDKPLFPGLRSKLMFQEIITEKTNDSAAYEKNPLSFFTGGSWRKVNDITLTDDGQAADCLLDNFYPVTSDFSPQLTITACYDNVSISRKKELKYISNSISNDPLFFNLWRATIMQLSDAEGTRPRLNMAMISREVLLDALSSF